MVLIRSLEDYILARDLRLIKTAKEDFAYLFRLYISNGPEFREMAKKENNLKKKYEFLKKIIGDEYGELRQEEIDNVLDKFAKKRDRRDRMRT